MRRLVYLAATYAITGAVLVWIAASVLSVLEGGAAS